MKTRKVSSTLVISLMFVMVTSIIVWAQSAEDAPFVAQLVAERDADIAVVHVPGPGDPPLRPVERVPRDEFGVVGAPPLALSDLQSLLYPSTDTTERTATLLGLSFFTTPRIASNGGGPVSNQTRCLGCHMSSGEAVADLVQTVSQVSRAARSSPTNFDVTGQGRAADNLDAIGDTGKTGAFTIFGDFNPAARTFNNLPSFLGFVQHTRPSLASCPPEGLPTLAADPNLAGLDPVNGWQNNWLAPTGFRRQTVERAAPPYIGRGLMEAIPNADILALADPADTRDSPIRDRISGRANMATTTQTIFSSPAGVDVGGYATPRLGRFGLRAQGPQLVAFPAVGAQEEVGATSFIRPAENTGPGLGAPGTGCEDPFPVVNPSAPDMTLAEVFSLRNLIRLTAPPEFGDTLLDLLQSLNPAAPRPGGSAAGRVQRGAMLFGVDMVAFANRMVPGRMPAGGDGRNQHAINIGDPKLNCAGCHTPVQRTGQSPANVGARHISFVWAPVFGDMLLHNMPIIDAERFAPTARQPLSVKRLGVDTFDLARNFSDDALPNQGLPTPNGDEFRTAPLMGLGRMGPPFFHDARVYLSRDTVKTAPASTVTTHANSANQPLVVRTIDDAIRAAIELHDLPAPRPGCPVPPVGSDGLVRVGNVVYGTPAEAQQAICPPLDSPRRSEARQVIEQFRSLSLADQQALIDFLKQL